MPPDHGMDHPACGGVLPRVARWVGNGRGMVLEDGTEAGRSRGRDEPTDGHPHPSSITRAGVWRSRAAATHGGAWRTRPPRAAWAWPVSPVQRSWGGPRGASRAGVARLTPRGGSTRGGRAALAEARAPARGAMSGAGGVPWRRTPRRALVGLGRVILADQAPAPAAPPRRVDRARRLGVAGRRVDQPPAVGDPPRGRGHAVRARARWPRGLRRWRGRDARGWRVAPRRRDPGPPRARRRGELVAGVGGRAGPSREPSGRPLRGGSRGHRGLAPLAARRHLPAMATPRGPQDRPAGLGRDPPLPPHGGEGRPRRPAVASGAGPDRRRWRRRTGLTTVHVHAGALAGGHGRGHSSTRGRGGGQATGACRAPVVLEGLPGTTAGRRRARCRGHAGGPCVERGAEAGSTGGRGSAPGGSTPGHGAPSRGRLPRRCGRAWPGVVASRGR